MTNATLNRKTELTSTDNTQNFNASLKQKIDSNNQLELNGEDFVILPASGRSPNFAPRPTPQNSFLKPAPGSMRAVAVKAKDEEVTNEAQSVIASSLLTALFPFLDHIKTIMEAGHELSESMSQKITLTETQNINVKDAIDPAKSFLPNSPFELPKKPQMDLWQAKRANMSKEEEDKKKKKKAKGLGSF